MPDLPTTLGALRSSGWRERSVRDEVRDNVAVLVASGAPLLEGLHGFSGTVVPQLTNALLAGHDIVLLGERGQAKSRVARSLVSLLDEWMPVVAGSELRDSPFCPTSARGRELVALHGDGTPIEWVHRTARYSEKLATPDTSVADLIGDVDPIKVAEGRYLSDEATLHFGMLPRANRGIFVVNELPDLPERIQVALLNVLEERDLQIRGHTVRLPLDVLVVASANPDDYTNRGRIVTPLKDRFGSQVRTHYPLDLRTELDIVRQEARPLGLDGLGVSMPEFMAAIVVTVSRLARCSPLVSQRSGVSVRLSIANYEALVANAARRALILGEKEVVPRPSDLHALVPSTAGKIELEMLEEADEAEVAAKLVSAATAEVFRSHFSAGSLESVVAAFDRGLRVEAGESVRSDVYDAALIAAPELADAADRLGERKSAGETASAVELVLEGLYLAKAIGREERTGAASYGAAG